MEEWQKVHILKKLPELLEDTNCSTQFWAYIKKFEILTKEDVDSIRSITKPQDQNSELYRLLCTRIGAYEVLIAALYHTKQSNLVRLLLSGYTNRNDPIPFKDCDIDITQDFGKSTVNSWLLPLARREAELKPISYQGTKVTLKTLCESLSRDQKEVILKALDAETAGSIINLGPKFVLVKKPVNQPSDGIYQDRTLTYTRKILDKNVFTVDTTSVFVFQDIKEDLLDSMDLPSTVVASDIIRQQPTARYVLLKDILHFDHVINLRANSNVFLTKYHNKQFYLEYATGNVEKIKHYIIDENVEISQQELVDMLKSNKCSSVVSIWSVPSMGKTMLLKLFANDLATTNDAFAAFLTFPGIIHFLKKRRLVATIQNITKILNQSSLDNPIERFRQVFIKQKLDSRNTKIYLFVDDLDKVQTNDMKYAYDILKCFEGYHNNIMIVTAARSIFKTMIKLPTSFGSFCISYLTSKEKLQMLTSVLCKNNISKIKARKCSKKVLNYLSIQLDDKNDLIGFPEHCCWLGEIIREFIGPEVQTNYLLQCYKMISFRLHYRILRHKLSLDGPIDKPYLHTSDAGKLISGRYRELNITYLVHLLAKNHFSWLPISKKDKLMICKAKNYNDIIQTGLLQLNICGIPEFIHKTTPEFIFAHYLFKRLISPSRKYGILYFIFKTLLCVIRTKVTIFENMPQQEVLTVPSFKFANVLYFLNYLIEENPFTDDQKQTFLETLKNMLEQQYFLDVLSASIYSDFRSIFEFCYLMYSERMAKPLIFQSLHEFDPIRLAARYVNSDSFRYYWTALRDVGFDEKHIGCLCEKITPIHISIHYGVYDTFKYLRQIYGTEFVEAAHLLHACIVGSVNCKDSEIIGQRIKIIKLMLKDNDNLLRSDVIAENNRTAILQPHTHIEFLKCLIKCGADVNQLTYSDNSTLHMALIKDNFQPILNLQDFKILFKLLKSKGFKHFDKPNSLGYTPLHLFLKSTDEKVVDTEILNMFQNAGADMNKLTRKGKNVLFLGTHSINVFNLLLDFKAQISHSDKRGRTILHTAILGENYKLVERILALKEINESFVNKQDHYGDTAMHFAVRLDTEHSQKIQLCLIAANANLHIENNAKLCAIVQAFRSGDSLTVSLETIQAMDKSKFPVNSSIASKCVTALITNPKFDYTCIHSKAFLDIFSYMLKKDVANKVEFGCLFGCRPESIFKKALNEFVGEHKAVSYLNSNDLGFQGTISENVVSETKASVYCYNMLVHKALPLFYSFRQKIRETCDKNTLFIKTPNHFEKILDPQIGTLVYLTFNSRLLIQRLLDCLGNNLVIYPGKNASFDLSNQAKVDVIIVNAGNNRQIFEKHSQILSRCNKVIYVTSFENTRYNTVTATTCIDSISWNDLSPKHQSSLKCKKPRFLNEENLTFSEQSYKSLPSNCLIDLISKCYVTLEVFCHLLKESPFYDTIYELQEKERFVQKQINLKAVTTIFPRLVEFASFSSTGFAFEGEFYRSLVDNGILLELEGKFKYQFRTKFHCFWYIGRSLALNCFDVDIGYEKQKIYDRLFGVQIRNVYIRSLYDFLTSDCHDNSICVVCFEFNYPVLSYFYNENFQTPELFLNVVGKTPKPYISACIRANLWKLLNALFKLKQCWFQDEDFVFIAINCSDLNTIQEVVRCFEESSKKCVRNLSLGRNSEITPLHVAVKRGNYKVVDYVLNTLQFKALLPMLDTPALFRYSVSFTKTNAVMSVLPAEVESRQDIFRLLLANVANIEGTTSKLLIGKIFQNLLVEVSNIHIDLIKLVVKCGANLWDTDKRTGSNIAHLSPKYLNADEYLELVKFIIKEGQGELFKSRNQNEESAVRCALRDLPLNDEHDEEQMCQILQLLRKEAGILFTKPNKFHKTILQCAEKIGHSDRIIQRIKELVGEE